MTGTAKRPPRITSFDVAEAAGVSQSTVSRALAGDPSISEPTRLRVAEAARKLNYQVDENAARLRRGRTGTLAIVLICRPGQDRKDINPFYYSLLGSACAAASARGYEVLVSFQDGPDNFWGHYQERRKADGLIVIGTTSNAAAWDYFGKLPEGTHWVCWGAPRDDFAWVRSDNHSGATLATRHMLVRDYTRIVCIGSLTSPQRQFIERYEGYAEAMDNAGLEPRLEHIESGLPREEQGRRAAARLVESGGAFDGIFAVCDEMALGALKELTARGVRVPEDVGVVGFDGIRAGAWSSPPLTTIEPDFQTAGTLLVDRLLAMINGEEGSARRVPVRLVVRGSTRA
ncbi:MAG: LacI family transcriptional regulator [Novosphingobium sp. SCN 66-18]|nr:MAG: LacI family transcriptional regulator [Novosphingobium sp. SCN 66-18]